MVLGSYFLFDSTQNEPTKTEPDPSNNISRVEVQKISSNSTNPINESQSQHCEKADSSRLISTKPMRSLESSAELIRTLTDDALHNPSDLLQKARNGDGLSAIAAFRLVNTCYPLSLRNPIDFEGKNDTVVSKISGCPSLPTDIVKDRFKLLEIAAKKGSSEAQITYAMNASALTHYYSKLGTNESVQYSAEILKKAELYGSEAVHDGVEDAYLFMSRSYQTGIFGARDYGRAYAYALPLTVKDRSEQMIKQIATLSSFLSPAQKNDAEELAFGCKRKSDSSELINPYK